MTFDDLSSIFVDELGATRDGETIALADNDVKVTVLVSTTDGVLSIPKVRALRAAERYLVLRTEEGHTFVSRGSVFGVRSENEAERGASRPGFG
jgi:hypothetical protein